MVIYKNMAYDPYTAVWLSHSSINDFLSCKRLYYIKNIFKDPNSKKRINIASPYLSLGVAIHNTLEPLKNIESNKRKEYINKNLIEDFKKEFEKFHEKKGGFTSEAEEEKFFLRGQKMIEKIISDPKILTNKVIPEKYFWNRNIHKGFNPNYPISEEENLVLNGAIDWIEYLEEYNAMRIVDFKTGRNDEDEDSFQLPIYYLLISTLDEKKKFKVKEVAYWYLDHDNKKEGSEHDEFQIIPIDEGKLEDIELAKEKIIKIGKEIKKFREAKEYKCNREEIEGEGCKHCQNYEKVYRFIEKRELEKKENTKTILLDEEENNVEYVGVSDYGQDMYFVK